MLKDFFKKEIEQSQKLLSEDEKAKRMKSSNSKNNELMIGNLNNIKK